MLKKSTWLKNKWVKKMGLCYDKNDVQEMIRAEVKALHKRLGYRLFGENGRDCLNLKYRNAEGDTVLNNGQDRGAYYKYFWTGDGTPENGVLGEIMERLEAIEQKLNMLEGYVGAEYDE